MAFEDSSEMDFYGAINQAPDSTYRPRATKKSRPIEMDKDPPFKLRCYQVKYRPRWIHSRQRPSKGIYLILAWTLLVSIGFGSLDNLFTEFLVVFEENNDPISYINFLPYIPWFVLALLSGWLADTRYGNHTMVRTGVLLFFVAAVLRSILYLAAGEYVNEQQHLAYIGLTVIESLSYAGRAMILVTSVQLGLEQMPDASSTNVTSFITWFVACLYAGNWVKSLIHQAIQDCWLPTQQTSSKQIYSLVAISTLCVVLCSDFLLSDNWLIKEGKCPQSSKTIFKVLKFAKQHKAPLNRSALTYWEEDIPSRIALGKSKYGGPFTTEEVENVRTTLRMFVVSISFGFVFTSFYLFQQFVYVKDFDSSILAAHNCSTIMLRLFTYETSLWVVGGIAIYEFAIYPLAVPIIMSSLKRIGLTAILTITVNGISLLYTIINTRQDTSSGYDTDWFWIVQSVVSAPLKIILLTSAIEFVCAQSPHHMKGLMIGYMWSNYYISNIIANILAGVLHTRCEGPHTCPIIYSSIATVWSITGLILLIILARWYKRRVRDDIATPHRWAEEAFERWINASAEQR